MLRLTRQQILVKLSKSCSRVHELVNAYASLPLGGTDASVIAVAELHGAIRVAALDQRPFTVVRPRHAQALELLP